MPTPPDLVIRRAVREDLPAIVQLLADDRLGATREADLSCRCPRATVRHSKRSIAIRITSWSWRTPDGRVVGVLQLTFLPYLTYQGSWRGLIEGVRVASDQRSSGIGRQLIEWAIDRAREHRCRIVQLTSDKSRRDAIRFYERLGFVASHEGLKLHLA